VDGVNVCPVEFGETISEEEAYRNKLDEIKDYVGNPNMLIIYNHKKVMKNRFGTDRLVKESKI
jgi:hypothetical protein